VVAVFFFGGSFPREIVKNLKRNRQNPYPPVVALAYTVGTLSGLAAPVLLRILEVASRPRKESAYGL